MKGRLILIGALVIVMTSVLLFPYGSKPVVRYLPILVVTIVSVKIRSRNHLSDVIAANPVVPTGLYSINEPRQKQYFSLYPLKWKLTLEKRLCYSCIIALSPFITIFSGSGVPKISDDGKRSGKYICPNRKIIITRYEV